MTIKMLTKLRRRLNQHCENLNQETENIKSQSELKNNWKNILEGIDRRLDATEVISDVEDSSGNYSSGTVKRKNQKQNIV